jgi:hypothetical protein
MMDKGPFDHDIATLVRRYAAAATGHGKATETGDHRAANRHHDAIAGVYRDLRARGHEAQTALLALLNDSDAYVRSWAAAHALEFAPERGEPVLAALVQRGGFVGLDAEMTLAEWRQGTLRFP